MNQPSPGDLEPAPVQHIHPGVSLALPSSAQARQDEPRTTAVTVALVVLVVAELVFVFLARLWLGLSTSQALQDAAGATAIGATAVHGRAIMLAVGRRLFTNTGSVL